MQYKLHNLIYIKIYDKELDQTVMNLLSKYIQAFLFAPVCLLFQCLICYNKDLKCICLFSSFLSYIFPFE